MVLTVDVGNTNIVLGAFEGDKLKFTSRVATSAERMEDEYAVIFADILRLYGATADMFDGAIIATVVPPLMPILRAALKKLLPCKILLVSPGIKTGLNIKIEDPGTLGSDLVCGAVAALAKYTMPCIIFDLGTAITISAMDKNGCFLGGTIFPGVKISLKALSSATAQLPHVNTELESGSVIGRNSIDSMKSGIVLGTASMMDGMIDRFMEELGTDATVIATGGMAGNIVPHCRREIILDENLLIDGLYIMYKKNR